MKLLLPTLCLLAVWGSPSMALAEKEEDFEEKSPSLRSLRVPSETVRPEKRTTNVDGTTNHHHHGNKGSGRNGKPIAKRHHNNKGKQRHHHLDNKGKKPGLRSTDTHTKGKHSSILAHPSNQPRARGGTGGDKDDTTPLIVGGNQASVGEYPYYVQWLVGCGGSLIAPDLVLTAAHCTGSLDDVIVGAYNYDSTDNGGVRVRVTSAHRHPSYSGTTDRYDFALLKLATPVTNKELALLNFDSSKPSTGQTLSVIGLGLLTENGIEPSVLQEVNVNYIATSTCNGSTMYGGQIHDASMFCAGVAGGGKDSCQGDSGGPIVIQQNGQDLQVGVVSWGEGCAQARYPGVYSRISGAKDWIVSRGCSLSAYSPSFCPATAPVSAPVSAPTSGSCATGSAPVSVSFKADGYPEENSFFLRNQATQVKIWDAKGFTVAGQVVERSTCIARNVCHVFRFFDTYGDGLESPGILTLKYDGTTVYSGGNLGAGKTYRLPANC